jgi:LEA14-like dessication related protein
MIKKTFILLITALFLHGCSVFYSATFKQPEIRRISNVKIENIGPFGCTVLLTVEVMNNNPMSGNLTKADYKLFVNNEYIASGSTNKRQHIGKNTTSEIYVPVSVKTSDLVPATVELFKSMIKGETLRYKIKGTLEVEADGIEMELPLDVENDFLNN